MNRKLDGTRLTIDDMVQIALDHGLQTEEEIRSRRAASHGSGFLGVISKITAKKRFELWGKGELKLDTRPD